jgi:anti-sigma regulatory factor (Ser/Thr protein kinase)
VVSGGATFRHEALFYRGEDDLLGHLVPFLRDGARAGDPMLVVLPQEKNDALQAALGADAEAVTFADMAEVGSNPARIIPAWRWFVDAHASSGRTLRGVGEPIGPHRSSAVLDECHRHESLLNVAFADAGDFTLVCPYDLDAVGPDVAAEALRTHPLVHGEDVSDAYAPVDEHAPFGAPLAEPPTDTIDVGFDESSLTPLREHVRTLAEAVIEDPFAVDDLVLAVNEIATNSLQHGGGNGHLRAWDTDTAFVCEVRDSGLIDQPLIGRVCPSSEHERGRGLWIANQVCDLVQVSSSSAGTAVRLHMRH